MQKPVFCLRVRGLIRPKALALIERGVVRLAMSLGDDIAAVRALFSVMTIFPALLADARLIRLAELNEPSRVLTLDSDFHIYRRHGRKAIPLITPTR